MDKKQLEILTNIIGAVESGGQVYGKRRYEAYAGLGGNRLESICNRESGADRNHNDTERKEMLG